MDDLTIGILLAVVSAAVGFAYNTQLQRAKERREATALCIAYRETLIATTASLYGLASDPDFLPVFSTVPSEAIADFRREDWFAVHHVMCRDLGKLAILDDAGGRQATGMVSRFFQDLKYVRETFGYLLVIHRAVALHQEAPASPEKQAAVDRLVAHAAAQQGDISRRVARLIDEAMKTEAILAALIDERPRLTTDYLDSLTAAPTGAGG